MAAIARASRSLAETLTTALRNDITSGSYGIGARLPSEARLAKTYGVSRSVVRESIAALRAAGLVNSRQGAGVFVREKETQSTAPQIAPARVGLSPRAGDAPFDLHELRAAVECEAARLAALRRSATQMRSIEARAEAAASFAQHGSRCVEADFALHMAIARASNNARFCDILLMLGPEAIPQHMARAKTLSRAAQDEHAEIVEAIRAGNSEFSRATMRDHLEASMTRYRATGANAA